MSGLVLKLAPKERVLINGVVIENGDRRGRFSIMTPQANVLRLRDAIHPDEVNTPVRRVCYAAQLVLSGDIEPGQARQQLLRRVEELSQVFTDADSRRVLAEATDALVAEHYYKCLKSLRSLLPREERLMAYQQ
ncbi:MULTISPECIES: flagellar biosynthesis repressor FlbT [Ruegeria]|jgi:flagellar protein FlbT|uniref:Flagellar biosynthesis repressor FlbT n=1 Tax=Ruegeria atlantica TaxID=81569 RepID=A0AA90Z0F4_9RHOB|nr:MULTISPECIES: flagellar biosynthesis repressor FlbT [Ruegeria]MCA0908287.1 flagellar biosynthesis repressor FlbT [Ruegeria marisrubri]NOC85322.1 flagellar biosynthesis repressor FlbT [Ruegeria sp. HKCCD6428]NOC92179.1 flagellar biosynthesis repressor FlbT [Ruegeria sp. HKCCD6604]NOD32343.1 flagellar biosynthesis repressor FlbT [Ruegeria atlantica]NOD99283.1 flagellar biosynthesis repressor FlbT [Ruegeria sp. HKCCD6228]